jgi:hypothetical protein
MEVVATDILPLVAKLSPEERLRLAKLALLVRPGQPLPCDSDLYRATPVPDDEFGDASDPLAWEADGWDDIP